MLALESDEWQMVPGSAGGDGVMTAAMLKELYASDSVEAWGELHNQINHQFTVGETAYVAAPHIVAIARKANSRLRSLLLGTLGSVVAASQTYGAPPIRSKWKAEFDQACADARALVAESLAEAIADREDSWGLLEAAAALQGHANLAMLLSMGPNLGCPECGEDINFADEKAP
jgi:hypothetical protein